MSRCPDWTALAAARSREPFADPPGYAEARAHLAHCADCRVTALAADPLFLFASLEPAESAVPAVMPAPGAAERPRAMPDLEMQSAVLALVRASRVAAGAGPESAGEGSSGRRLKGAKRTGASRRLRYAAGFVVASLLAFSGANRTPQQEALAPPEPEALAGWVESQVDGSQPMIEELDRPEARVYELSNADLAVVMIVDAGLDV